MTMKDFAMTGSSLLLLASGTLAFPVGGLPSTTTATRTSPLLPSVEFEVHQNRPLYSDRSSTRLYFFGGMFGGDDDGAAAGRDDGDLAVYPSVAGLEKFDSLQDYLKKWAKLLEEDPKGMGLTTKVKAVVPTFSPPVKEQVTTEGVKFLTSVQLLFQPPSGGTGYGDKDDKKDDGGNNNANKKKKKKAAEGGVEVVVLEEASGRLKILARRCNMDEDTMVKEMSEQAILDELKKAIRIWKEEAKV